MEPARIHLMVDDQTLYGLVFYKNRLVKTFQTSIDSLSSEFLKSIFTDKSQINQQEALVYIFIRNALFTIVPQAFQDDTCNLKTMELLSGPLVNHHIFSHSKGDNSYLQALPLPIWDFFNQQFDRIRWVSVPEVYEFFTLQKSFANMKVTLSWHHQLLIVLFFDRQKLVFCNSYKAKDLTEVLYYILFVQQQFISPKIIDYIQVFTDLTSSVELKSKLDFYFKSTHIQLVNPSLDSALPNSEPLLQIPELYTLNLCV